MPAYCFIVILSIIMSLRSIFRILFSIFILLSISVFLFANTKTGNGEMIGSVTNIATGRPIAGATISIPDLKITVVADKGGHYVLSQLPKGSYLIQITAIGFAGLIQTVDFSRT